ncbi:MULTISPECIES: DnaJ domain-containing protein [Helcococcus]|uniref:DnaJ domain-containing protein n=1 Tax=Helcococcus bovis TaxID=3153252 RepID=A0ABW9F5J3_9FIRM
MISLIITLGIIFIILFSAFITFFEITMFITYNQNFIAQYIQAPTIIQMGVYLILIVLYLLILFLIKRKCKILYLIYTSFIVFGLTSYLVYDSYKPKDRLNWIVFILAVIISGIILYLIRSKVIVGLAERIFDDIFDKDEDLWFFGLSEIYELNLYNKFINKKSSQENTYEKTNLPNIMEYMHEWNNIEDIPKIVIIESGTNTHYKLSKLENKFGKENLIEAIRKINKSSFLKGYKTNFIITFEWFLEEDNFVKVLSGRYTDRKKTYKKANNSNSSKDTEQSKNNSFEEKYINCCEILGVDVDCEETELKRKYMQLSKVYHPDQNKNKNSQKKFIEITEAYEFIKDNQERYIRDFVQNEQK